MTHGTEEKTARDSFTKYAIVGTLTAILAVVGATVWQRHYLMTSPTREAQESLEEYRRATEELRRLQEEGK